MPIDIIFLIIFLYGFWQGWNKGIIGTILNLTIYIFGIMLSYKMASVTSTILERMFNSTHPLMFVAGFATNLLIIYFVVYLASHSLENMIHGAYMGVVNRVVGGAAIAGFYILLYSVLLWFGNQAHVLSADTLNESRTYPFLKDLPGKAKATVVRLQPLAFDVWDDSVKWMDNLQDYGTEKANTKTRVYELPDPIKGNPDNPFETQPERPKPAQPKNEGTGIVE
jgi:membrane protein required for colicin V production